MSLAADRLLGESPIQVFAFGSYSKNKEEEKANEWKAKNVTPILYREHRNHAYLHRTLQAWADTYRDGVLGKERIVSQYATVKPLASTRQDDFVGRVLWALSDSRALPAKRFAELNPAPPLDWLELLTDSRFGHGDLARFGVQPDVKEDDNLVFGLVLRPTPYVLATPMALVHRSHASTNRWDEVMHQLARWLTRHLHNPNLILWVAKQGGVLHSEFARLIARALEKKAPSLSMLTLWQLALSGRLQDHSSRFDFYEWRTRFKQNGLTPTLRLQLRDHLSPKVRIREPFSWPEDENEKQEFEALELKDLVDWEIVLATNYVHSALKDLAEEASWREALPALLSDATALLRDTLDLMHELGGVEDRHDMSYLHQPSVSDHPQNRDFHDWTALIDLARDAWLATAEKYPERARLEAERWLTIPYPLFRRLAFFAATNSGLFGPAQALAWLLAEERWWLWSVETRREALRLLVALASQLDAQGNEVLEQAILLGPPNAMFQDHIQPDRLQRTLHREIWLRLAKYHAAGAKLGLGAAARLSELAQQYPAWQLAKDERDEFPVWMGDGDDWRTFLATPKSRQELVVWLRDHSKSDTGQEDDWRERCRQDFPRTTCALLNLAHQDEWFPDRWTEALQVWTDEKLTKRSWRYVSGVLAGAPDEVVKDLTPALSWWLQSIAKVFSGDEQVFFTLIRRVLAIHHNEDIEVTDDPVSKAINHPIGHVTEAVLRWWYRQELQDGGGLPVILKVVLTDLCDTDVTSFQYGRVLLATHVIALFRVDKTWTTQYLLPLFDWRHSVVEASGAWKGFLRSPRLYRPLIEAIKPQFLATAQHYADLGEHGDQYAVLLTFAALELGDTFTKLELAAATRSLTASGLHEAAQALVRALGGAGEQRAEYWRNRVLPYLKSIWPKSRDVITPAILESLARLCVTAENAFPEALRELKHWLQPLSDPDFVVHLLNTAKLCRSFPEEALIFLNAIIGDYGQWPPTHLKDCLDSIRDQRPEIKADDRFKRLNEYLRRHGQE